MNASTLTMLAVAVSLTATPLLSATGASAQNGAQTAPMEDAGTAGEHVNKKDMPMHHGTMKKHRSMHHRMKNHQG